MNPVSKRLISATLISVLCLHFTFLCIQTSPLKIRDPKINFITKAYVGSFFYQNWNLFVPAPKSQHYLFIRYKTAGNWTKWADVLGDCVENNHQNHFRGNEAITLLFSNSLIYVLNKIPGSNIYKQSPVFPEFKVLHHELSRYLLLNKKLKEGEEYEILIGSVEPGNNNALYFQSLRVIK